MQYATPTLLDNISLNLLKYGKDAKYLAFITGGLAYLSLGKALDAKGMAVSNASWNVYSTILATAVGFFIWNENLDEKKILGISLAVISLYLMNSA